MLLSCSGGCPEGQLSNRAVVELTNEGFGEMFCFAGIGAGKAGFVQSARDVDKMVVLDGCDTACAKVTLEKLGIDVTNHVVVSKLSIENKKSLEHAPEDVAAVKHSVKLASGELIRVTFHSPKPLSPGDRVKSRMLGGKCC
jgi:uncharacterized metal-binding protein